MTTIFQQVNGDSYVQNLYGTTATITGAANVGPLTASASTITGNETVAGTFGATGAATLGNTLAVTGAATLNSTVAVTGTATLNGALNVAGSSNMAAVTNTGLTTNGNASTTGNETVGGNLSVTGNASFAAVSASSLNVSGNETVVGTSTIGTVKSNTFTNTTAGNNLVVAPTVTMELQNTPFTMTIPATAASTISKTYRTLFKVTSTSTTAVAVQSIPTTYGSNVGTYCIKGQASFAGSTGGGVVDFLASVRNVGGSVTGSAPSTTVQSDTAFRNCTVSLTASGSTVTLNVVGLASTTILWTVLTDVTMIVN